MAIPAEWAKKLETMNREVEVGFNALDRRLSGRMFTDILLWEAELKIDPDIDLRWEQLW